MLLELVILIVHFFLKLQSKSWHVFNDETVHQLSGKKLLIDEDSLESDDLNSSNKNSKPVKGIGSLLASIYCIAYKHSFLYFFNIRNVSWLSCFSQRIYVGLYAAL